MQSSGSEYEKDNVEEMTNDKANEDIEHVISCIEIKYLPLLFDRVADFRQYFTCKILFLSNHGHVASSPQFPLQITNIETQILCRLFIIKFLKHTL